MAYKQSWYQLPEADCERLNRKQMGAVLRMYNLLSDESYFSEDMVSRLEMIPNGKRRMHMALGQMRSIVNDITGTIPVEQCKRIHGTMKDYESRLVPKFTPTHTSIVLEKDMAKMLVDYARAECKSCVKDGEECRQCKLYKLLVGVIPCDDYESGNRFLCPYSNSEWAD